MREKYESLSLAVLKDLAKARGLKGVSTLRKPELVERMLQEDEKEPEVKEHSKETEEREVQTRAAEEKPREFYVNTQNHTAAPAAAPSEASQLDSGEKANGILEVMQDGFGFILRKFSSRR